MTVRELCKMLAYDLDIVILRKSDRGNSFQEIFRGMAVEAMLDPDFQDLKVREWDFRSEFGNKQIYV